nr:putative ribonuclease H-like domain-containing protein [Tanacetum cinerariifolium]
MASASPICLMARASSTKSWLWHQHLSHLNFDTINDLAKNDLVSGLPKFKYHKEHLCPSCEQGKIKRASHPPKPVPNSRQRLYLLHMDLCGPMRIASINEKRYVLVIVDDYSLYTSVHFLRSKDEAPEALYGLKQAPRAWYDELSTFLLQNHFFKGTIDLTLFIRCFHDDILVAKPTKKHLKEVKRIFCYLRGTVNTGLWYSNDSGFELIEFSDADYTGCKDIFKSTFGGAQFLGEKLVSWSSKKQDSTALHSQILQPDPTLKNKTHRCPLPFHKGTRGNGTIELYFVKTDYKLADLFTKALPADRFNYLVRRL